MSTILTEAATFGSTVTVPVDGDTRVAASVVVPFQTLANRTQYLNAHSVPDGTMIGGSFLQSNMTTVYISPISLLVIGGVKASYASLSSVTPTGLTPSTWYYIYARISAGTILFDYDTVAPDISLVFKTGDVTRRYIGCFRAVTSTDIPQFVATQGRYVYSGTFGIPIAVNNVASTGSWQFASLSGSIPPHALITELFLSVKANSGDVAYLQFATNGASDGSVYLCSNESTRGNQMTATINVDTSQFIQWRAQAIGGSGVAFVRTIGFTESR